MTEEELTKKAKEIIKETVGVIELPHYVTISESDDGGTRLLISLFTKNKGTAFIFFNPLGPVQEYLRVWSERGPVGHISEELHQLFVNSSAAAFTQLLIENFYFQCAKIPLEVPRLAMSVLAESSLHVLQSSELHKRTDGNLHKRTDRKKSLVDEILEEQKKTFKVWAMKHEYVARKIDYSQKEFISLYYESLHPLWKEIKKCYEDNQNRKNWELIVKIAYPDVLLPDDLILQLSDIDPYISAPSTIALEHSARLCGFYDNSVSIRTLHLYLKESKEWVKDKSDEEINHELLHFHRNIVNNIMAVEEIHKLEGASGTHVWEKLIYKIFAEELKKIKEEGNDNAPNQQSD